MNKLFEYTTTGKNEIVKKDGDFFYKDGKRLPDTNREGFQTTIFRKQFNPPVSSPEDTKNS